MWGARAGNRQATNQSSGVQLKPNNGRPENQLPFTPYGLELYKTHKALEGADAVSPAQTNDPRVRCEPLGVVRHNHYDLGVQIFQDEYKIAMLYQYDNRWRIIWTDGRALPKDPDPRWYGYSVGHWEDDTTFVVNTIGTDERSWLDNAGNPHSADLKVEERYHRVNHDLMELTVTLDDPKAYTRPWTPRNKMPLTLAPANFDMMEMICSPTEVMEFRKNINDRTNNK